MLTVDELLEQAKRLPLPARRELRDRLDEGLQEEEGPYASLLRSAGTAHSVTPDVARNKNTHLADVYASKRSDR